MCTHPLFGKPGSSSTCLLLMVITAIQ